MTWQIRHTALSNSIVLARIGKNGNVLETRDVHSEFWHALCSFAFDGKMPEIDVEAEIRFGAPGEDFVMTLRRVRS